MGPSHGRQSIWKHLLGRSPGDFKGRLDNLLRMSSVQFQDDPLIHKLSEMTLQVLLKDCSAKGLLPIASNHA